MPSSSDAQQAELPASAHQRWTMLLALISAFALSQAYRTLAAILAPPLQYDFGLSAQELGLFAGTFHFAFGALQLAMGIGINGPRQHRHAADRHATGLADRTMARADSD